MKQTNEKILIGLVKKLIKEHPYPNGKNVQMVQKKLDKITGDSDGVYYQPKFDKEGNIVGDEFNTCYSFQVWKSKKNLMNEYPNCTPVKYSGGDIEDPTFMD